MKSNYKNLRLKELDALRGIAALFVVFFHCTMFRPQSDYGFFLGITGVDLFFMISGFVILLSINKSKNGKTFLLRRLIRLFPNYWLIVSFTFFTAFILHYLKSPVPPVGITIKEYLFNLTMFQYYFDVRNIDGSYWTLIIELQFYFLIFILYQLKLINKIILTGIIFCLLILVYIYFINTNKTINYADYFHVAYHFPTFFIGILFYKIYNNKLLYVKYFPLIICCLVLQLYLMPYYRVKHFMTIWWYGGALVFFCVIFSLFVFGKLKFITNKITVFLGDISYTLYLIHQSLVYTIIIPYFVDERGYNFWIVTLFIAVPTAIILSGFITYKIEIPIRKYLRKKLLNESNIQ